MVGAALPEAPAVAGDVPDHLVLVGEVHLPDEGAVAEHPHVPRPVAPGMRRQGRAAPGAAPAAAAASAALHAARSLSTRHPGGCSALARPAPSLRLPNPRAEWILLKPILTDALLLGLQPEKEMSNI